MVFQDPMSSLDPRQSVESLLAEGMRAHGLDTDGPATKKRLRELLVGRGPARRRPDQVPPRVLRRPAPAHRHRPGAVGRAQADRRRRAGLGPRRVGAGAGDQPARRAAGRVRPHLPRHRPRPGRGAAHQRPDRRDVPRRHGRGGHRRRPLRPAAAPLHPRAAVGRAGARPARRGQPPADPAHRRPALAVEPARPDAGSTPGARGARRPAATTSGRSCASSSCRACRPATGWPATGPRPSTAARSPRTRWRRCSSRQTTTGSRATRSPRPPRSTRCSDGVATARRHADVRMPRRQHRPVRPELLRGPPPAARRGARHPAGAPQWGA